MPSCQFSLKPVMRAWDQHLASTHSPAHLGDCLQRKVHSRSVQFLYLKVWHCLGLPGASVDGGRAAVAAVCPVQDSALCTHPTALIAEGCWVGPTYPRLPGTAVQGCAKWSAVGRGCGMQTWQQVWGEVG